ncbi:MAG: acyl-CoA dehydrogenase family protein [Acidobacteriota bacterium]
MLDKTFGLELTAEERDLLDSLEQVCRETILPIRAELDRTGEYPHAAFDRFRELKLFQAIFNSSEGGSGFHPLLPLLIYETLSEYCLGIATCFALTTGLAAWPLRLAGTEEQKEKYLAKLVSGECLGGFAATEPEAGSDILSLSTRAVKQGDRYLLNGTKKWISNSRHADFYCVLARTGSGPGALSFFMVEGDAKGLSFGKLEDKLGLRCVPNSEIYFENVEVPEENLIGGKIHRGLPLLARSLAESRLAVAAASVGQATGAYREAMISCRKRQQFGERVSQFQVVQHMLVDMLVKIETARAMTHQAGRALLENHREAMAFSAMAKYHCSEMAMAVVTEALQLHGGYGFIKDNPIEKMFRDTKILAIYEGTSQVLKNQIGDSMMRYLKFD